MSSSVPSGINSSLSEAPSAPANAGAAAGAAFAGARRSVDFCPPELRFVLRAVFFAAFLVLFLAAPFRDAVFRPLDLRDALARVRFRAVGFRLADVLRLRLPVLFFLARAAIFLLRVPGYHLSVTSGVYTRFRQAR